VREESESVEQEGLGERDGGGRAAPAMRRSGSAANRSPDRDTTHPQHRRPPSGQSPLRSGSVDSALGSSPPPIGTATPAAVELKPGPAIGHMLDDDDDDLGESGEIY
tara:strand:- start:111 stop:431 length:321 start_codon:yes stop_codon:yes gene_type:complete